MWALKCFNFFLAHIYLKMVYRHSICRKRENLASHRHGGMKEPLQNRKWGCPKRAGCPASWARHHPPVDSPPLLLAAIRRIISYRKVQSENSKTNVFWPTHCSWRISHRTQVHLLDCPSEQSAVERIQPLITSPSSNRPQGHRLANLKIIVTEWMLLAHMSSQKRVKFGSYTVISLKDEEKECALVFSNIQIVKVCGCWPFC